MLQISKVKYVPQCTGLLLGEWRFVYNWTDSFLIIMLNKHIDQREIQRHKVILFNYNNFYDSICYYIFPAVIVLITSYQTK